MKKPLKIFLIVLVAYLFVGFIMFGWLGLLPFGFLGIPLWPLFLYIFHNGVFAG